MNHILEVSLRTIVGFVVLLLLTRIIGKKLMGQLTIFTYITGVAMGNMAGDMVVHKDIKLIDGVTGLIMWAILTIIIEYISIKSSRARVFLDGEPTIVIKKGEIMQDKLSALRLNMDDLTMLLRTNNVFSVMDVEYAILEPNGQLSIVKKQEKEPVSKKDLSVPVNNFMYIPTEIIVDGRLVKENLTENGLDQSWINKQLEKASIKSIKDIFYAELQRNGDLFISKKKIRS